MDHTPSLQVSKPYTRKIQHVYDIIFYMIAISLGILLISSLCFYTLSFDLRTIIYPATIPFKTLLPPPLASLSFSQLSITPPPPDSPSLSLSQPYQVLLSSSWNKKSKYNSTYLKTFIFHNMTDQELFLKASMVKGIDDFTNKTIPKVAFMFLVKGKVPLAPLWEKFFKDNEGFYSIYLHQDPSYKDKVSEDSVFYGRKVPSQHVVWGTTSMIDGEKRLLANALLDSSNQRFVLLSETCIPLFGFKTIYIYLINSKLSYVNSFYDPTKDCKGRYNPKMSPIINITNWRKGSQWFEIHRNLAINIVHDTKYYPMFNKYCLPRCYSDEHYIPTLVHMMYSEFNSNRTITWVDWSIRGPHPRKYVWGDINDELMNKIRFGSTCVYNGKITNICFLFGRKFHPNTLDPLLRVSPSLLGDYYP
ncbi:hypothetical protein Lal_00036891 [Lupinus albus]|uniref:Putative glycosyl transferase, family 14 n=1 Tax=Lupinus albus TaxID=3870 RepID=A0A6A4PTB6_LUPAL|nr:putative glycosyl transferase, family 14 [Lupinus albus]KAF1888849.1 hypothetical protein Lal_00036891 [Lupinus albus]